MGVRNLKFNHTDKNYPQYTQNFAKAKNDVFRTNLSRYRPFKPQTFRQTNRPFSKILQNPSCCKPVQKIPQFLYVNLPEYKPENVQVKINKNGTVELSASKDLVVDSGRNGQRRTTTHFEQTFDLPEYLRKENLLDQVSCKFDDDRLVFSYPEMPVGVKMQINMEEDMIDDETGESALENL